MFPRICLLAVFHLSLKNLLCALSFSPPLFQSLVPICVSSLYKDFKASSVATEWTPLICDLLPILDSDTALPLVLLSL